MESTNFSLKSLDWSNLLKESSEDSCDSDDTFLDVSPNKNLVRHCDLNPNKHKSEIDHEPMAQEILGKITSNQNRSPGQNEEGCSNHSDDKNNMQYDFEKGFKLNNESHITDSCQSNFKFLDTSDFIDEGGEKKQQFESDFGFTDDMISSLRDMCVNNLTLQRTGVCNNYPASSTGCNNSKEPEVFGLDSYLILKCRDDQSKMLESDLKPYEEHDEKSLGLVSGANYLPFEEQSARDENAENVEEDVVFDGLTPNLDCLMTENFFDNLIRCGQIPQTKPCSPPLTLSKGTRRKVLPADKVLPKYRKKNLPAGPKLLPARKCSSAYIDLSSRKCGGDEDNKESSKTVKTSVYVVDSEAHIVKVQPQNRKGSCRKQLFEEVTKTKSYKKGNQSFPYKVKRGRKTKKKKGAYVREKQETETTSESASQERKHENGVDLSPQEVKNGLEQLEDRVARWVSGSDVNPPTRQLAFTMLADAQTYIATLQHLKKKNDGKRKFFQKSELKLIKLLLERSRQLEIAIDKAIAEADRLMNMELSEISEDSRGIGKEIFDTGNTKENKYLKPILKNSSSEPSTEEGLYNKQHISFSEEVEFRYLSCSEQSSSLSQMSCSQVSFYEHSSDNKESNFMSRLDKNVSIDNDFNKYSDTKLASTPLRKSQTIETHKNIEPEAVPFQNLTITPSNSPSQLKSEVRQDFKCIQTDENNILACDRNESVHLKTADGVSVLQSETSFQFPTQAKLHVHTTVGVDHSEGRADIQFSDDSAQYKDHFTFSEQTMETEEKSLENVIRMPTIMDIKYVRVPLPSECLPWDPSDNWSDLEG